MWIQQDTWLTPMDIGRKLLKGVLALCIIVFMLSSSVTAPHFAAVANPYKTSNIEVKKIGNRWVSCRRGTQQRVNYTGVAQNNHGWWRVKDGIVDFKANGIYQNDYGWWKTTSGKVTFSENGVFKNEHGWWRVEDSKVNFDAFGVYQNKHGWWYVCDGKVRFDYSGLAPNENGIWKISSGKVDFDFTGSYRHHNVEYWIDGGKATSSSAPLGGNAILFGDSILSGFMIDGAKRDNIELSPMTIACDMTRVRLTNDAVAGRRVSSAGTASSISGVAIHQYDLALYDTVFLAAGINDYFAGVSLGADNSDDTSTFNGALNRIFSVIEAASSYREAIGLEPIDVVIFSIGYSFNYGANSAGLMIEQYNNCINKRAADELRISSCRFMHINTINRETVSSYTSDGLHPNKKGANALALDIVTSMLNHAA